MSSHSNQSLEMLEAGTGLMPDPAELSTTDYSEHTHDAAPTRFVDIVVPTVNSYNLQQNLPNAELILFPDSNHGSHFQFTELFNRYVADFLDREAPGEPVSEIA